MGSTVSKTSACRPPENEIYSEEQILQNFGDAFDMPQNNTTESGYVFDVENPYRALRGWYLSDSVGNVLPFPPLENIRDAITPGTVLHGWLVPPNENNEGTNIAPVYCSVSDFLWELALDRSKEFRGYWVMRHDNGSTNKLPIYWLQEPDLTKHSESELMPHRTFIAIASNIHDLITKEPSIGKHSVAQMLKKHPCAFSETLLREYKDFCITNLEATVLSLTPKCTFLKSVRALKSSSVPSERELLRLTLEAEERSQQYPWGQAKEEVHDYEHSAVVGEVDGDGDGKSSARTQVTLDAPSLSMSTECASRSRPAKITSQYARSKKRRTDYDSDMSSEDESAEIDYHMKSIRVDSATEKPRQSAVKKMSRASTSPGPAKERFSSKVAAIAGRSSASAGRKRIKATTQKAEPAPVVTEDSLQKMGAALRRLQGLNYLVPFKEPDYSTLDWWKQLQASRLIRMKNKSSADQVLEISKNWTVAEDAEACLVLIEAFRQRSHFESARKAAPKPKKVAQKLFQSFVFNSWVEQALSLVEDSIKDHMLPSEIVLQLISSLLFFVGEHKDIKDAKDLLNLVEKRGVHLRTLLASVHRLVYILCRDDLSTAYDSALKLVSDAESKVIGEEHTPSQQHDEGAGVAIASVHQFNAHHNINAHASVAAMANISTAPGPPVSTFSLKAFCKKMRPNAETRLPSAMNQLLIKEELEDYYIEKPRTDADKIGNQSLLETRRYRKTALERSVGLVEKPSQLLGISDSIADSTSLNNQRLANPMVSTDGACTNQPRRALQLDGALSHQSQPSVWPLHRSDYGSSGSERYMSRSGHLERSAETNANVDRPAASSRPPPSERHMDSRPMIGKTDNMASTHFHRSVRFAEPMDDDRQLLRGAKGGALDSGKVAADVPAKPSTQKARSHVSLPRNASDRQGGYARHARASDTAVQSPPIPAWKAACAANSVPFANRGLQRSMPSLMSRDDPPVHGEEERR